jgi:hypothetical protein
MDERSEIDKDIAKATKRVSNLEKCIDFALKFVQNMPSKWLKGGFYDETTPAIFGVPKRTFL